MHLFFKLSAWQYSLFPGNFPYLWPCGLSFLIPYSGNEVHRVFSETSIGLSFFPQEVPARAIDDANVPVC